MTAADAASMAVLRPANPAEAIITGAGVNGWTFQGVCFDSPGGFYNHVYLYNENLGGGNFRNTQNIIFDRIVIVGDDPNSTRTGLYLNGSATVTKSHIANIHKTGEESKAIVLQEGPGPFTITDNYLEAASINVLFGGGDTSSSAHIANDILVEDNYLFKKPAWHGAGYAVKNIFELKTATNVTVRNNLMENNWADAQDGYAILFQPVNDTATSPWNKVENVVFEDNIIQGVENGINILGYEWQVNYTSGQTNNVTFRRNLFIITGITYNDGRFIKAGGEVGTLVIENNTVVNNGNIGAFYAGAVHPAGESQRAALWAIENLTFRNNLTYANGGLIGDGTAAGNQTLDTFVDVLTWTNNVLANRTGGESYPLVTWHPSSVTHEAEFSNLTTYDLKPTSTYINSGYDSSDLGWRELGGAILVASLSNTIKIADSLTVTRTSVALLTATISETERVVDTIAATLVTSDTLTTSLTESRRVIDQLTAGLVGPTPVITTTTLPNGVINGAYAQTITETGGQAPLTFSVSSGSLPPGLTLNTSTGQITGTPTSTGIWSFTIQVTDNSA
jgi:hypothetical protein